MKFRTETHHYFGLPNGVEVELPLKPEDWLQDEIVTIERPDGGYRVAYLVHDDHCSNPLDDCDGMGKVWHHPRSRYGKSDGYYEALGLDSYGDQIIDEDKLQQMWHDAVMAVPPELFTFPDELVEHRWEPSPAYSSKGELVPYWVALRQWLADEAVADVATDYMCFYAWRDHLEQEVIDAVYGQIEPHFSFNYASAYDECRQPIDKYAVLLDVYDHSGRSYSLSGGGMQCRWDTSRGEAVWIADDEARKEIDSRAKVYAFGEVIERGYRSSARYAVVVDPLVTKFLREDGGETGEFEHWCEAYQALRQHVSNFGEPNTDQLQRGHDRALYEVAETCVEEYDNWQRGDCYSVISVDYDAEGKQVGDEDACWGYIGLDYAREERDSHVKGMKHV